MKFRVKGAKNYPSFELKEPIYNVLSKNKNGFIQVLRKKLTHNNANKVIEYLLKTGSKNKFYIEESKA